MRTLVATMVACGALAATADAEAKTSCRSRSCEERVADKQCKRSHPLPCYRAAALAEHVPMVLLVTISRCESGLRWWPVSGGGAMGPMQFLRSTWDSTPFHRRSPFSFRWAPRAAGWLIRTDGVHHWNPSRRCWGRVLGLA